LEGFEDYSIENYLIFYGVEPLNPGYKERIKQHHSVKAYASIQKKTKTGLKEWWRYYKLLKQYKPDVIIQHSPQLILVSYLYRLFNDVKIITVEHDAISIRTKTKWLITNLNSILANYNIVLTPYYKEQVKKHLWFKKLIYKYHIIPNGIDCNKYQPKKDFFTRQSVNVLMASRLNKLRDHETLIKAVIELNNSGLNIQLRIAGDGDTLKVLKEKFHSYNYITFLGNLDEDTLLKEYYKTDIYVHATFAETFSTAILQAMSCGLPIIASDIQGVSHMIKHKKNGLLFKNREVHDLVEKISMLFNDKKNTISLGNNARKDVEQKYCMKNIINKYLKLINNY